MTEAISIVIVAFGLSFILAAAIENRNNKKTRSLFMHDANEDKGLEDDARR